MITPVPLLAGASTYSNVTDLWWHYLLNDKCATVVTNIAICPLPFEMILPGEAGPRQVWQGLALFTMCIDEPRALPRILAHHAPLLRIDNITRITFDMEVTNTADFVTFFAHHGFLKDVI